MSEPLPNQRDFYPVSTRFIAESAITRAPAPIHIYTHTYTHSWPHHIKNFDDQPEATRRDAGDRHGAMHLSGPP